MTMQQPSLLCWTALIVICFSWISVHCDDHKSSSSIKFPSVTQLDGNIKDLHPRGHLQQFGHQRPSLGQVPEYFTSPSPRFLWENHVNPKRPAIIRNLLNKSPALTLWDDRYLTKEYGSLEVLIEKKFEDRKTEPKRMQIDAFLEQYDKHNWYVVSVLPNEMRKDIEVPKPLMCSSFLKNLQELNLWIGTHGTRSMLHYDADNILHCVVSGSKDWMLIDPRYKFLSDIAEGNPSQVSGFSVLNVDRIDLFKSPDVADIPWEYATLNAGDCIYLPPQYMHQVRSYNRTISVTFLFFPHNNFSDDDCADINLDEYRSLSDIYVYWGYEKGQETVDMGYKNPLQAKQWFRMTCQLSNLFSLKWKEFIYLYTAFDQERSGKVETIRKLFDSVDTNQDAVMTLDELMDADIEVWKELCRNVDSPHGPTKSSAASDPKLTSSTPEFNPRQSQHYIEATYCKDFLLLILAQHDTDAIPYHMFKKATTVGSQWSARDAFIVVDINMDGFLTRDEINHLPVERLKFAYSMDLQIATSLKLNVTSKDEDEVVDEEEEEDYVNSKGVATVMRNLKKIHSDLKDSRGSRLKEDEFIALVGNAVMEEEEDRPEFDASFLFRVMDRDDKGYITVDDIALCLRPEMKQLIDFEDVSDDEAILSEEMKNLYFSHFFKVMVESTIAAKRLYDL